MISSSLKEEFLQVESMTREELIAKLLEFSAGTATRLSHRWLSLLSLEGLRRLLLATLLHRALPRSEPIAPRRHREHSEES